MTARNCIISLFLSLPFLGFGQSIQSEVLSCFGGEYVFGNAAIQVSATGGEAIGESSIQTLNFHSGFQQGPLDITTSLANEIHKNHGWIVFPNPGNGYFRLVSDQPISFRDKVRFEIFDAQGKLIQNMVLDAFSQGFDLSNQAAGVYYIRIYDKKKVVNIPVMRTYY